MAESITATPKGRTNSNRNNSATSRKSLKATNRVIILDPSRKDDDRIQIVKGDNLPNDIRSEDDYNDILIPNHASEINILEKHLVSKKDVSRLSDPEHVYSNLLLRPLCVKALQENGWRYTTFALTALTLLRVQYITHVFVRTVALAEDD